jgi:hypothetical protein
MKRLIELIRFIHSNKKPNEELICYRLNISHATMYRLLKKTAKILNMEIIYEGKATEKGGYKIKNYGLINKTRL